MSRWQKRSQEEKEKILADQREREKPRDVRFDERLEEQNKIHMELMKSREIPLRCDNCGWVKSEHYTLVTGDDIMSNERISWISGTCVKCGKAVSRPLHIKYMGLDGSMVIAQICMLLDVNGRLTDKREKT